jgi:hypothetical protein
VHVNSVQERVAGGRTSTKSIPLKKTEAGPIIRETNPPSLSVKISLISVISGKVLILAQRSVSAFCFFNRRFFVGSDLKDDEHLIVVIHAGGGIS